MNAQLKKRIVRIVAALVLLLVGWLSTQLGINLAPESSSPSSAGTAQVDDALLRAIREHAEDVLVRSHGQVVKLLPDDDHPPRHQRFLVELGDGHTVLISHNIDLAPRVPLREGQQVSFQGDYIWNEKGGVIHWTHHDPRNRRTGGWIEVDGKRYK